MPHHAIILAAGRGQRLKKTQPKAFLSLGPRTLLEQTISTLSLASSLQTITLVVPRRKITAAQKLAPHFPKIKFITAGGATRFISLVNGYRQIAQTLQPTDLVLIQNAANPNFTLAEIRKVLKSAQHYGAAGVGHPVTATLKKVTQNRIQKTLDRSAIWFTETPQALQATVLAAGIQKAQRQKITPTDDLSLAELTGRKPRLLRADPRNRKITNPVDLENLLNRKTSKTSISNLVKNFQPQNPGLRLGFGQDSHPFAKQPKPLILAGIEIQKTGGLAGNSDGDLALHALTNALSSALGGFSLSNLADPLCRRGRQDSRQFLAPLLQKMQRKKWQILNLALAFEGQKPKLEKHLPTLQGSLSKLLKIPRSAIGLTATTGENLTAFGKGLGLQVFAVILLAKHS